MNKTYLLIFKNQTIAVVDITDMPLDEVTRMIKNHHSQGRKVKVLGYSGTAPHLRH